MGDLKLVHGNTYVLKQRDQRGIVTALTSLHPLRVTALVAPGRQRLLRAHARALSGLQDDRLVVPARR